MKVLVIRPSGARLVSRELNSRNTSVSYANGSSLSWVETNWLHIKIPTFLKLLMMVMSGSVDHGCSSIMMESSMVVLGNSSLKSIVLMYLRITLRITFDYYLAFKDHITPWSIYHLDLVTRCVTQVVFWGKKMRSMAINPGPCGCLGQLSTIKCYFTILSEEISIQLFHPICEHFWVHPAFYLCLLHTRWGHHVFETSQIFGFSNDKYW